MATIYALTFDSITGRLVAKLGGYTSDLLANLAITTAKLADFGVLSGKIGSGAIGFVDLLTPGLFTADANARAKFANEFLVSGLVKAGAIGGGLIRDLDILSGKHAALSIQTADMNWAAVVSGKIASAAVGHHLIKDQSIMSGKYVNYSLQSIDLNWASLTSGKYAPVSIMTADIGLQEIRSGNVRLGEIGDHLVKDLGILSGKLASGAIWSKDIGNLAIVSGKLADNSINLGAIPDSLITEAKLIPGISIDIAETLMEGTLAAIEPISSGCCVYVGRNGIVGGLVGVAMAVSGTMPAVGIVESTTISGSIPLIKFAGRCKALPSIISGQRSREVFVGTDGQVSLTPPSTSGKIAQRIGVVMNDSSVFLMPSPISIEIVG